MKVSEQRLRDLKRWSKLGVYPGRCHKRVTSVLVHAFKTAGEAQSHISKFWAVTSMYFDTQAILTAPSEKYSET
ncbi:hypothetical protein TNCT_716311 [Trichonephila clavata]|uniref:Uncharacterized protein n=1 Tax=Trichonephila clavata TaxID=2740835 RepID=A0A8X6FA76_TRICU|nr:hypothetical protein TNCT_716311 [Trichonephila clavata]